MKSKELWYAVNGSGQGCVFTTYPERNDFRKIWLGNIEGIFSNLVMQLEANELVLLPALSWKDEPVKLELNLNVCLQEHH